MKKIKKTINIIATIIIISLIAFTFAMNTYPEQTSAFIGFRTYVVLTNSMEPTIPTHSLVAIKVIDEDAKLKLKKGDIITFKADRFDENILITHRFNKMQKNDEGIWCYRTNAEGKDNLDMYETKRSDIVGTYLFHIPYVGKMILFLQSKFGFLLYAELFLIWCVNKLISARWKEKEEAGEEEEKRGIKVSDIKFNKKEDFLNLHIYTIEATLQNTFFLSRKNINITVKCFNNNEVCFEKIDNILPNTYLHHKQKTTFSLDVHVEKEIDAVVIIVNHAHK